jgi:osmotically-inducible protein OsmY
MSKQKRWTAVVAGVAAVAAVASMAIRHNQTTVSGVKRADMGTAAPQITDDAVYRALSDSNVAVDRLVVRSAGGIVILRGNADADTAEKAVTVVRNLGAPRVANLITPAAKIDDETIRRQAERNLAGNGTLAGCVLRVSCENGVLRVTGTVQHELQKDAARSALRGIRGAQRVHVDLSKV